MMKYILLAIAIASLTGCSSITSMMSGGDQNDNDIGRWSAYARAAEAQSRAQVAFFDAKKAEIEAIASAPTTRVEFTDSGGNPVVIETNVTGPIMASKQGVDAYGVDLSRPILLPKGAIAEIIGEGTNLVKTVVQSPFAVGVAVGMTATEISKHNQGGVTGEYVTIKDSNNHTNVEVTGDGTATGSSPGESDIIIPTIDNTGDAVPEIDNANTVREPYIM